MTNFPLILLLEINRSKLIFSVIKNNEQNDFNTIYTSEAQSKGIENSRISDYDKVFNIIKENIFKIEKLLYQSNLIKGFDIKKKYPNVLTVNIYEKKPIAILQIKKKKILFE